MSVIRQRTKNLIYAGLVGVLITMIFSALFGIYTYKQWSKERTQIRVEYEERLQEAEVIKQKVMKQRKKVLISKRDIKAGEKLTAGHFVTAEFPIDELPKDIIDNPNIVDGKVVKIDISKNGTVIPSMLFEEGITPNDLRNQEFKLIELPSKLKKDDFLDVRVKFPTGQDYIVLSKKKVRDLVNGTVWYQMNEKEILKMSSAIVDAYLNNASIYGLSYVDPYMQKDAIVTYPANKQVLDLIEADPNIVGVAKTELERRHREKLERDLKLLTDQQLSKYKDSKRDMDSSANTKWDQNEPKQEISNSELNNTQENPLVAVPDVQSPTSQSDAETEEIFKDNSKSMPVK
ncbi:SAF domain-containing protein [Bacillus cereus]|uniref:SAF domain-containing protein n=1 Tax=Paenibacillus melissococcoides TaxID=2912268 RepID=UPI0021C369A4|nr:SAF domain-containing protein [Paenibacillus melissococcoides]MEB9896275.1 SAF domain-containing protein [Bacillus cereus]CAH8721295.1 SAF domain-containing protein [Paenibacillus melissococcoides]